MVDKQLPLEYKVALLKYLINTREWLHEPRVEKFWEFVGDTFAAKAAPQGSPHFNGKELEALCKHEVDLWGAETNNKQKRRRVGHEQGTEYDLLMKRWVDVWDAMMIDYWKMEIETPGPNFRRYDIIPEIWRSEVEKLVLQPRKKVPSTAPPDREGLTTRSRSRSRPPKQSQTPIKIPYEQYDPEKLKRVVDSAKERAIEVGKESLAHAVQQIYEDALDDSVLRLLLEKILTHQADPKENIQFQEYVRKAKRKLRDAKAAKRHGHTPRQHLASRPAEAPSPQVNPVYKQEAEVVMQNAQPVQSQPEQAERKGSAQKHLPRARVPPHLSTRQKAWFPNINRRRPSNFAGDDPSGSRVDSAHASEQRSDKGAGSNSEAIVSVEGNRSNVRKVPEDDDSSSEVAEEADLAEAERAAKRLKRNDDDDSGNYRPHRSSQAMRKRPQNGTRPAENPSRASSVLSSHGDTDVEAAKEAYVDELVRRQSAEASRQAIEAEYGPVSPTIAGDARSDAAEDWASMPSPQLMEKNPMDQQAIAGAQSGTDNTDFGVRHGATSTALTKVPSPPPAPRQRDPTSNTEAEELTPDDSSHAYRIITGAAAEAVAPAISRLEEKIDALITRQQSHIQQPTPPPQQLGTPSSGQQGAEPLMSSPQELMALAQILQSNDISTLSPEAAPLVAQLIKNAAEAAIHAADAARKAGKIARDVSMLLMQSGERRVPSSAEQNDQ